MYYRLIIIGEQLCFLYIFISMEFFDLMNFLNVKKRKKETEIRGTKPGS